MSEIIVASTGRYDPDFHVKMLFFNLLSNRKEMRREWPYSRDEVPPGGRVEWSPLTTP
jgi:hypothetical protein